MTEQKDLPPKIDFNEQITARKEEIAELEQLVREFTATLQKNLPSLVKSKLVEGFRLGVIATLDYLDQKAIEQRAARQMRNDFIGD